MLRNFFDMTYLGRMVSLLTSVISMIQLAEMVLKRAFKLMEFNRGLNLD